MTVIVRGQPPAIALLGFVGAVDVVALATTLGVALATTVLCWGLYAGILLGPDAFAARAGGDALVLLLVCLSAYGFAAMIRAVRRRDEEAVRRIPVQRRREPVG